GSTLPTSQDLIQNNMVPCNDFLAETKEVRGVVVEDVALLLFRQERRLVDDGNRALDRSRPDHLARDWRPDRIRARRFLRIRDEQIARGRPGARAEESK